MVDALVGKLEFSSEEREAIGWHEFQQDGQALASFQGNAMLERRFTSREREALKRMLSMPVPEVIPWRYEEKELYNEWMCALGAPAVGEEDSDAT